MRILIIEKCVPEGGSLAEFAGHHGFNIVGSCHSGDEAESIASRASPDICIYVVDEQETGIPSWLPGFLTRYPLPLIVSMHGLWQHAGQSIAPHAFLPRPYRLDTFNAAINTAIMNFSNTIMHPASQQMKDRIFIKDVNNFYTRLMVEDVLWVKGEGNYIRIATSGRHYVIRQYLGEFLKMIGSQLFIRVHKSYLINLKAIREIRPTTLLIEDQEIPVARSYRDRLMNRILRI